MKIKFSLICIILSVIFLNCKTPQIQQETLAKTNIESTYSSYEQMTADFTISGQITGKSFSYYGRLNVENAKSPSNFSMDMVIKDAVFQASLSSLQIKNSRMIFKDLVNQVEKEYDYKNSSIAFYSNQEIPMEILIPLFTGYLPDGLISRGKKTHTNGDVNVYKLTSRDYELAGFFKNSTLTTLVYNPGENYNQITFEINGAMANSINRYFPEKIKVSLTRSDFFEITFKQIHIK